MWAFGGSLGALVGGGRTTGTSPFKTAWESLMLVLVILLRVRIHFHIGIRILIRIRIHIGIRIRIHIGMCIGGGIFVFLHS